MNQQPTQTDLASSSDAGGRRRNALAGWWPLLLPPLVVAGGCAAGAWGGRHLIAKSIHEVIALCLLSAAAAAALKGALTRRDQVNRVLTVLSVVFLCREIHFAGTTRGAYIGLAVIAAWCAVRVRPLLAALRGTMRGRWLVATVWAYAVSLLIQRRVFKFIPGEHDIHVQLEEVTENLGHLMLAVLALL